MADKTIEIRDIEPAMDDKVEELKEEPQEPSNDSKSDHSLDSIKEEETAEPEPSEVGNDTSPVKEEVKEEQVTRNFAFASVVATKNIKKGEKLTYKNIWVKRPGNGDFEAREIAKLIGKIAKKNINNNFQIKKNDII